MFAQMRSALGIPKSVDILEHIYSLATAEARASAMESVRAIERAAMASQRPQPGLAELMAYLERRGVRKAICTRNFDQPVHHLLTTFLPGSVFAPIVTREFRPPKPHPAGILHIARSWGLLGRRGGPEQPAAAAAGGAANTDGGDVPVTTDLPDASSLIMVGDSIDDMTAGRRAGAATVLLRNPANAHLSDHEHTDLVIERLDELVDVLERGFVGDGGGEGETIEAGSAKAQGVVEVKEVVELVGQRDGWTEGA